MNKFKTKPETNSHPRFNKAAKLLNKSSESYYWLGMLMADGTFSHKCITLISKEEDNLERFKDFLEIENKIGSKNNGSFRVNVCDVNTIQNLVSYHGLLKAKTYNPPLHLSFETEQQFASFIIGFIDGDGCIQKRTRGKYTEQYIQITIHSNWLTELGKWCKKLNTITNVSKFNVKLNNKGYACWYIRNPSQIKYLYTTARNLKLPYFKRKWDILDIKKLNSIITRRNKSNFLKRMQSNGYIK